MQNILIVMIAVSLLFTGKEETKNEQVRSAVENQLSMYPESTDNKSGLHDFIVTDINGKPYDLSQLKGKKVLIVNVASKCGLTPHYTQLQELWEKYKDKDFIIIGFPCNDFGAQEPGSHEEIMEFCQINYGVTFPLMSKISVKGEDKAPLYKWLTEKTENGIMDAEIVWNFQKFMIDENGRIVECIPPQEPFYEKITEWVE